MTDVRPDHDTAARRKRLILLALLADIVIAIGVAVWWFVLR
jgi:hypothetical protein